MTLTFDLRFDIHSNPSLYDEGSKSLIAKQNTIDGTNRKVLYKTLNQLGTQVILVIIFPCYCLCNRMRYSGRTHQFWVPAGTRYWVCYSSAGNIQAFQILPDKLPVKYLLSLSADSKRPGIPFISILDVCLWNSQQEWFASLKDV